MAHLIAKAAQILYPQDYPCAVCGSEWPLNDGFLCADCAAKLKRTGPVCLVCGRTQADTRVCGQCACRSFDRAFAAFDYVSTAKECVAALKFRHDLRPAQAMARCMAAVLPISIKPCAVTFVPMTPAAQKARGFNQAQLLALTVAQCLGLPVEPCLVRLREGKVQHSLTRAERLENALLEFGCPAGTVLHGTYLLVDDVLTTGSTADACAAALKAAGAKQVYVLTFASVPNLQGQIL